MSVDPRQHRMCTSKAAYRSPRHARTDLKRIIKRGMLSNNYHAYRCPYCQFWHIGSRMPKQQVRESRRRIQRDQEES